MTNKSEPGNLLIILTRNPELGKCKTRLAASIGDKKALEVYQFLLNHTMGITSPLPVDKIVYYSEFINHDDIWDPKTFKKALQKGPSLGDKMAHAFRQGFDAGYKNIVLIGSDVYHLNTEDLKHGFKLLRENEAVIGPADDGGYYLLGLNTMIPEVFIGKEWGTETVLEDTLADLKNRSVAMLPARNDVDVLEDIKNIPAFRPFLIDLDP